jgi:predicted nucleotide-binding protein
VPHITKETALSTLQKLVKDTGFMDGSFAHVGWYRSVKLAVARVFGEQSSQMKEIATAKQFLMQKVLLESMVHEIEEFWDENEDLVAGKPEVASSSPRRPPVPASARDPKRIFVVHGRNNRLRLALFQFLRSIGLSPIEWSQAIKDTGRASPYIGEVLDAAFSKAQAVLVLMTPDDMVFLREELRTPNDPPYERQSTPQARPNVLFEAGMAMGRSSERTILVEVGDLRPFSDVGGRHVLRLNNSTERRQELAQRLESAGCPVDLSGTDWHREGDFNSE